MFSCKTRDIVYILYNLCIQKAYILFGDRFKLKKKTEYLTSDSKNFSLQAVMASDFAIAQFRFLERLLLVQGHWCYRRIAMMVKQCFYLFKTQPPPPPPAKKKKKYIYIYNQ